MKYCMYIVDCQLDRLEPSIKTKDRFSDRDLASRTQTTSGQQPEFTPLLLSGGIQPATAYPPSVPPVASTDIQHTKYKCIRYIHQFPASYLVPFLHGNNLGRHSQQSGPLGICHDSGLLLSSREVLFASQLWTLSYSVH